MKVDISLNGQAKTLEVEKVLLSVDNKDEVGLTGTKFGCGVAFVVTVRFIWTARLNLVQ